MSNEFHNRPQSRRGRESHHSRYTTELETRGTIEDNININEYESLSFDPKVPPHPRRPSRIQVPRLKSSASSYRQDSTIARKREVSSSNVESPLAQAQRLQSSQHPGVLANATSYANRFLQAGLSATIDQVHQATEPYAATKNKGKHSRAAQSTSLDVLASALLQTKQRTPRNTIDLCDEDDDDDDDDNNDDYHDEDDTTSIVDNGGDDHEVSSDLGQVLERNPTYASPRTHTETDAPGYIKLLQSTNKSRPHSPIMKQQRSFTLKKTSSFPAPSHSPTRGSSPTPKRRLSGETTGHSSTPPLSQDDRKRERNPLSHAVSQQIHLAQRPKVDFSNTLHSPAAEVSNHTKVWDVETSTTRRSTSTVALQDTDSDDEDHHPRPKKKQKIGILKKVEGVTSAIGQWLSPKAKKKRLDKTKGRLIGFSEGTPTHQLPDDLRSTIHGSNPQKPDSKGDSTPNPMLKDKSKSLRQVAEAIEDDDDWSRHKETQSTLPVDDESLTRHLRNNDHKTGFFLSKANNNVKGMKDVAKRNSYGSGKPKATKINPGCTFQQKTPSRSAVPRTEESPPPNSPETPLPLSTGNSMRRTRSSTKMYPRRHHEVVEIDDSDSEIEEVTMSLEPIMEMELIRIAVGKKVATAECVAKFDPTTFELHLTWKNTKRARTRSDDRGGRDSLTLALRDGTLEQFVVYSAEDKNATNSEEQTSDELEHLSSFVAMRISPNKDNLLYRYSKSYIPDHQEYKFRYVIMEFRDITGFSGFVEQCVGQLPTAVQELYLEREQCVEYAQSLLANNHEEKLWRQRNKFVAGRALDYTLLVFPFVGDPNEIENAAEGLTEASRSIQPSHATEKVSRDERDDSDQCDDDEGKPRQRAHFVTINVEDYDRLDPGEWLNDSLVDFWMQWISRYDTTLDSKFHFFTSHFFSRLSEEGHEAVASWTRRKKINIFEKKFIFIPINKSMHWSLCVVVNPGAIVERGDHERTKDDPLSCMIFMDSLRMHNKKTIAGTIRNWLNSEWRRMYKDIIIDQSALTGDGPFDIENFKLFSPRVPLQNNTWDCGVFVCRYAHAIYELRHRNFTYGDAGMYCSEGESGKGVTSKAFKELISDSAEFNFDMEDIARFREEFKTLIEKLSGIYLKMKNAEKMLEQEQKRQQRKTDTDQHGDSSAKLAVKSPKSSTIRSALTERAVDNTATRETGGQKLGIEHSVAAKTSPSVGCEEKDSVDSWSHSQSTLVSELDRSRDLRVTGPETRRVHERNRTYDVMEVSLPDQSQYTDSLNVFTM